MKTILYSIIAIIIFGMITMGFTNKANTKNMILIQSVDSSVSSVSLSQSAKIISNRLKDFNSQKYAVTIIPEKNQIQVILTGNWDLKVTESLLIQKGTFAFYETYNRISLTELLSGAPYIYSLFKTNDTNDSSAIIGCAPIKETEKINDYLNTLGGNQKCKFAWNHYPDNSDVCLYALKIDSDKGALIKGNDIESVKFHQDKKSKNNEIEIRFKESVVELWADITKRNINNAIAIVLDNKVLSAPTVRSSITGGHSTITGNFSQTEARYIAALGNNGELPLNFNVVK
jgi:preprotein translocase subunit SecD